MLSLLLYVFFTNYHGAFIAIRMGLDLCRQFTRCMMFFFSLLRISFLFSGVYVCVQQKYDGDDSCF